LICIYLALPQSKSKTGAREERHPLSLAEDALSRIFNANWPFFPDLYFTFNADKDVFTKSQSNNFVLIFAAFLEPSTKCFCAGGATEMSRGRSPISANLSRQFIWMYRLQLLSAEGAMR
jgi:hypothetical protein